MFTYVIIVGHHYGGTKLQARFPSRRTRPPFILGMEL